LRREGTSPYNDRMRKLGLIVGLLLIASTAEAKILEIYAQAQGGGMYGKGLSGAQKDNDFFFGAKGASYGAKVGAEVMWVDAWIEHNQFTRGDGISGTWTQFMAGFDYDFPIGDEPEKGKPHKTYAQIGIAAGFGMGTGQQVDPPLSNDEITDKGFVAELSFGGEYRFNKLLSIGLNVPITYGYIFKNGVDANDEENQYHSIHGAAYLYLSFHIELK
jgi:hypothetical protein